MPDHGRPLDFDPDSPEQARDREFLEPRTPRNSRAPRHPGRHDQVRTRVSVPANPTPGFFRIERNELIDKKGREEHGLFFPKQEVQWVDEDINVRQESVGRVYESGLGRFITGAGDAGARCQHKRIFGAQCGALIHREELNHTQCTVCGRNYCARHLRIEAGVPVCRRHRKMVGQLLNTAPLQQPAGEHAFLRSGIRLFGRILKDTFTVPEGGARR